MTFSTNKNSKKIIKYALVAVFLMGLSYIGLNYTNNIKDNSLANVSSYKNIEDQHVAFVVETYDMIKENYWDKITDEQLSELFQLALNHTTGGNYSVEPKNISGLEETISDFLETKKEEEKKDFVALLAHTVLQNLQPLGRSALYTTVEEKQLRDNVSNIDREKDIYDSLSLVAGASMAEVEKAYKEKKEELEGDTSEEAKAELEKIEYAHTVLANESTKARYDETKAEPTVFTEIVSPNILYMKMSKLSPQTFNEFIEVSDSITDDKLNTLIFDLRGNVGGAVDTLQWFLGPFIGPNQYAYEFFQQEDLTPYKTKVGWLPSLVKYKRVVILIDGNSQSSAEIMAATFTKYNVGVLVGEPTKGWGTIENTFPMQTKLGENTYSLFLVHSITLRPDGQPIEGRGVDPIISITDPKWKEQLNEYFNDNKLINTVAKFIEQS